MDDIRILKQLLKYIPFDISEIILDFLKPNILNVVSEIMENGKPHISFIYNGQTTVAHYAIISKLKRFATKLYNNKKFKLVGVHNSYTLSYDIDENQYHHSIYNNDFDAYIEVKLILNKKQRKYIANEILSFCEKTLT